MDLSDGSLDGALFMFTVDFWNILLFEPRSVVDFQRSVAIGVVVFCWYGHVHRVRRLRRRQRRGHGALNAFTMGLANNSISIIPAGLAVLSTGFIFAGQPRPLATVTGGSSAITFLALPEVFAQAPGGAIGPLIMTAMFFLALSFAALTSMMLTVEALCPKLR